MCVQGIPAAATLLGRLARLCAGKIFSGSALESARQGVEVMDDRGVLGVEAASCIVT